VDKVQVKEALRHGAIKAQNPDQVIARKLVLRVARCHSRDVFRNTVSKI
jgi:hypothetical protein